MIGRLRGQLVEKRPPWLLLDVNGVGYEIEAPMSTFYDLPALGAQVQLHTHLHVREDAHVLYGFVRESERSLFRALLKISGVGAKMALAILSGMSAEEFSACVQADDSAALTRLPGIGKKTAERLIVEMRDRLSGLEAGTLPTRTLRSETVLEASPVADAVSALVALGYKPNDASRMVRAVEGSGGLGTEDIIKAALQAAAQR